MLWCGICAEILHLTDVALKLVFADRAYIWGVPADREIAH